MGKKASPIPEPPPPVEEEEAEPEPPVEQHEGEFCWSDGSAYSGQYCTQGDEKKWLEGKGKLQTGEEVFEGLFKNGLYKEGKYTVGERVVYEGHFRQNIFHGPGTYYWPDGRSYRGMWQHGKMHGIGDFENFCIGVNKVFTGFALKGEFESSRAGQAESKKAYLKDYQSAYTLSASAMLSELLAKMQPPEPVDPKEQKGKKKVEVEDVPVEIPKDFAIPAEPKDVEEEEPDKEAQALRTAVEELASGPYPSTIKLESLKHFVAHFAPGAEKPGVVTVFESQKGMTAGRLKSAQLEHLGQGVELMNPHAEPAALKAIVVVNTSTEYDAAEASWRVIYTEDAPVPDDYEPHHHHGKKK